MGYLPKIFVALVAIEHIYILILEMFLWTKPRTLKIFGIKKEDAEKTKSLAANQGLYNGFLSAGLIWGLLHPNIIVGIQVQTFFLSCVLVAAIYGGITVKKTIIIVQGLPALLALAMIWFNSIGLF
jgi:putative membrane protein